ncbi:MAG: glycosyltransferase family 2 protein [Candidatus Omnitrophica bacterium]|nr:glycosyltransferase family 2 protein [Candidatus Omnitrophota bacterium]
MPLLSVIVPVYNEAKTVRQIIEKIHAVNIDKEIIVIDNCSTDGTQKILTELFYDNLKVIYHSSNRGKGASFLTGLDNAKGDYIVVQDADLEYDPNDYLRLFEEIKDGKYDMVSGARFFGGHQGLLMHVAGNKFLTFVLNSVYGSKLNDCATCYKLARREIYKSFRLERRGFDIDFEIICKALRKKLKIKELQVYYHPRSYKEGKKIRVNDAFWAVMTMLRYRFWR